MIASAVICFIYIFCAVILFFGVREQKGKEPAVDRAWGLDATGQFTRSQSES